MINWGLANQGGTQNALQMGLQLGTVARQREQQNALLEQQERRTAVIEQNAAARAQQQAAQQRRADLPMAVKLLETATDEASYQRNLGVAQQYGIDTSAFPRNFDPAWREQNLATMKLLTTPQGQQIFSTLGKEVADMGFQPGTPEFTSKVGELWAIEQRKTLAFQQGGGALEYDPSTGETRLLAGPQNMTGGGQGPQGSALPYDNFRAAIQQLGPQGAQQWAQGKVFQVATPEEAEMLPPGTRILLPDGTEGVVP